MPPGVVNMVFGTGPKAGAAIVQHPDVPLISFTGSTPVGELITKLSAPFHKKLSLEVGTVGVALEETHPGEVGGGCLLWNSKLPCRIVFWTSMTSSFHLHVIVEVDNHSLFQLGGKNAAVVFEDTDLEKCLPIIVR